LDSYFVSCVVVVVVDEASEAAGTFHIQCTILLRRKLISNVSTPNSV